MTTATLPETETQLPEALPAAPAKKFAELAKWSQQDQAIAALAEQYGTLTIAGIEDKAGLAVVHEARMVVKSARVEVEKTRVRLKADALAYGRAVDAEAKRLTGLLEPITEEWLRAVGFKENEYDGTDTPERTCRAWWINDGKLLNVFGGVFDLRVWEDGRWDLADSDSCIILRHKGGARGKLRALCRALGIQLKEPSDG